MTEPTAVNSATARPEKKIEKLPRATIAWVDDQPQNNLYERRAFASAGVFCDTYTNNSDVIKALNRVDYDLVISDIGRADLDETGWDLLSEIKDKEFHLPFVFYTWGITDEARAKVKAEQADGITETPDELIQLVFDLTT